MHSHDVTEALRKLCCHPWSILMTSERRSPSSVSSALWLHKGHHLMLGWVQLGIKANGKSRGRWDTGRQKDWVKYHLDTAHPSLRLTHVYLLDVCLFVCFDISEAHLESAQSVLLVPNTDSFPWLRPSMPVLDHSVTSASCPRHKPECHTWGFPFPQSMSSESPASSISKTDQKPTGHFFTSPWMISICPEMVVADSKMAFLLPFLQCSQ